MKILKHTCFHNTGKLLAKSKAGMYIVRITKGRIIHDYKRFYKSVDAREYYFSVRLADI